ncbi:hypothetical protein EASAB2608_00756 [Streptomyces sp. EAS-AB2608]|nr:hypothetical protein EASAB2608_00756 [Streptomyces sp. EAS-AB2608]
MLEEREHPAVQGMRARGPLGQRQPVEPLDDVRVPVAAVPQDVQPPALRPQRHQCPAADGREHLVPHQLHHVPHPDRLGQRTRQAHLGDRHQAGRPPFRPRRLTRQFGHHPGPG